MPRATRPYLKIQGRWVYLYRAIDRSGVLVDVMLSETRGMKAAKAFFRSEGRHCHHAGTGYHGRP